jgi:hypothetical protein
LYDEHASNHCGRRETVLVHFDVPGAINWIGKAQTLLKTQFALGRFSMDSKARAPLSTNHGA